jgi:hypothetical protein
MAKRFEIEGPSGEPVALSLSAFQLHQFAIHNSVADGTPGFISDKYLNAIDARTAAATDELCAAGLWERGRRRLSHSLSAAR